MAGIPNFPCRFPIDIVHSLAYGRSKQSTNFKQTVYGIFIRKQCRSGVFILFGVYLGLVILAEGEVVICSLEEMLAEHRINAVIFALASNSVGPQGHNHCTLLHVR
jgi:hypothetical protein